MTPRILRALCVPAVVILLVAPSAQGQTGSKADSVPAIDKLKTPQSPAFVILGLSPANIVHPTTPASVATSLMSSLNSAPGGQPLLPKQFGLEAAPFWLAGHPTLTLTRLQEQTTLGGPMGHVLSALWANTVQTLTVGVAASDSAFKTPGPSPADTSVFRLGFSVRASPIRGRWVAGCVDSLEAVLARLSAQVGATVAAAIAADPTLAGDNARLEKVNQKALAASRAEADSTLKSSQGGTPGHSWRLDVGFDVKVSSTLWPNTSFRSPVQPRVCGEVGAGIVRGQDVCSDSHSSFGTGFSADRARVSPYAAMPRHATAATAIANQRLKILPRGPGRMGRTLIPASVIG